MEEQRRRISSVPDLAEVEKERNRLKRRKEYGNALRGKMCIRDRLLELFYRLEQEIRKEHISISLVRGMEIMSIGPLNEKIKERKLIPLHESRYYLIEVPFDMAPDGIRRRLMEFPAMGKIPVLAHPERYFCVQDSPELLYEFREMGAVLQMNKGSVFGRFGKEAERTACLLYTSRCV